LLGTGNHWEATGHVWVVDAGIWVETITGARCRKDVQEGLSAVCWVQVFAAT